MFSLAVVPDASDIKDELQRSIILVQLVQLIVQLEDLLVHRSIALFRHSGRLTSRLVVGQFGIAPLMLSFQLEQEAINSRMVPVEFTGESVMVTFGCVVRPVSLPIARPEGSRKSGRTGSPGVLEVPNELRHLLVLQVDLKQLHGDFEELAVDQLDLIRRQERKREQAADEHLELVVFHVERLKTDRLDLFENCLAVMEEASVDPRIRQFLLDQLDDGCFEIGVNRSWRESELMPSGVTGQEFEGDLVGGKLFVRHQHVDGWILDSIILEVDGVELEEEFRADLERSIRVELF